MISLPSRIVRMRLARENKLHRPVGIAQQFDKPLRVHQQQIAAFIRGEPASKTDRQCFRVEHFFCPAQFGMKRAAPLHLCLEPLSCKSHQPFLASLMRAPKFLIRNLVNAASRWIYQLSHPTSSSRDSVHTANSVRSKATFLRVCRW